MTTKLGTFKAACRHLGEPPLNTVSPNPSNLLSRSLNSAYEDVVERCLTKTNFNFAQVRGILARLDSTPKYGFAYYYQRPADALRIVYLSPSGFEFQPMPPNSYVEDQNDDGTPGGIATDAEALYARWNSRTRVEMPGLWEPNFARFVSLELALEIAPIVKPSAIETITKARNAVEHEAIGMSAVQQSRMVRKSGSWSTANRRHSRGGNGGGGSSSLSGAPEQN